MRHLERPWAARWAVLFTALALCAGSLPLRAAEDPAEIKDYYDSHPRPAVTLIDNSVGGVVASSKVPALLAILKYSLTQSGQWTGLTFDQRKRLRDLVDDPGLEIKFTREQSQMACSAGGQCLDKNHVLIHQVGYFSAVNGTRSGFDIAKLLLHEIGHVDDTRNNLFTVRTEKYPEYLEEQIDKLKDEFSPEQVDKVATVLAGGTISGPGGGGVTPTPTPPGGPGNPTPRPTTPPIIGQAIGLIESSMKSCEYEEALQGAEQAQGPLGNDPTWQAWAQGHLGDLQRTAQAQKAAREHLRRGKAAIEAKKLDEAIAALQQGLAVPNIPDCLKAQMTDLLQELERHRRFARLTDDVAKASNVECDFRKALTLVGEIEGIAPLQDFMRTWLTENKPKLVDLQNREKKAMELLAQGQTQGAAAQQPAEYDAAINLLEQARDMAPACVRQKLGIDGLIAALQQKKNPTVESSIVLLIDTSGSMSDGDKIGQAKRAAEAAVRKASRSTEMAVLAFDGGCSAGSVRVVHEFSSDANSLMRAISGLAPGGGTPMYIATGVAVEYAKKSGRGKSRIVVLMSDGGDSCRSEMANAAAGIRTSNIPVNTIGFDVGTNQQAKDDLSQLSGMTGGRSLGASASDPREIIRAFDLAMLPSLLKGLDVASGGGGGALQGYFSQAKSLVAQQDIAGAVFQFQQAQKLAPDSPAVHFNLSLLHEANDQLIPAMNHAREYLKLAPSALDRADVENRVTNLQDELRRNPREMADPTACRDLYNWAQAEQEKARRAHDADRRQKMLEILIASQKGDCGKAGTAADAYKRQYGAQ
jgi:Mg-chelatase subunit ChlD